MYKATRGFEEDTNKLIAFVNHFEKQEEDYFVINLMHAEQKSINRRFVRQTLFSDDFKVYIFKDIEGSIVGFLVLTNQSVFELVSDTVLLLIHTRSVPKFMQRVVGLKNKITFSVAKAMVDYVEVSGFSLEAFFKMPTCDNYTYSLIPRQCRR